MLAIARRQRLLERLAVTGQVEIAALVKELGCSPETLRRDLGALEQAGKLRRVHGGAVGVAPEPMPALDHRIDQQARAKSVIAALAAERVVPGSMVFLGGGSTVLAVAARLLELPRTTFVTTMIDVAAELGRVSHHDIFLAGGQYLGPTRSMSSPETLHFLMSRMFDLAIIGITAIDLQQGYMGPSDLHIAHTQVVRRQSRKLMVVCDSTKFDRTDRYRLLGFSEVDILVSNVLPPAPFSQLLADAGTMTIFPAARTNVKSSR